jgi:glycosyltransferase involved in cell wall biosynthesis
LTTTCTLAARSAAALSNGYFPYSLTVFFPAYNDAPSLPILVEQCFKLLDGLVPDFEVLVVNDGSTDESVEVLTQLQERFGPELRVIDHGYNRGYGAALRSGFSNATKEWVFYTDGDGQYDLNDLPTLLAQVTPETGFVNGYKVRRSDAWHRVLLGRIYNAAVRKAFGIRIRDVDCDFRLIRRSLLQDLALRSTSGTICLELVRSLEAAGTTYAEIPVRHLPRRHGRSQFFRFASLIRTFRQLSSLYWDDIVEPRLRRPV